MSHVFCMLMFLFIKHKMVHVVMCRCLLTSCLSVSFLSGWSQNKEGSYLGPYFVVSSSFYSLLAQFWSPLTSRPPAACFQWYHSLTLMMMMWLSCGTALSKKATCDNTYTHKGGQENTCYSACKHDLLFLQLFVSTVLFFTSVWIKTAQWRSTGMSGGITISCIPQTTFLRSSCTGNTLR